MFVHLDFWAFTVRPFYRRGAPSSFVRRKVDHPQAPEIQVTDGRWQNRDFLPSPTPKHRRELSVFLVVPFADRSWAKSKHPPNQRNGNFQFFLPKGSGRSATNGEGFLALLRTEWSGALRTSQQFPSLRRVRQRRFIASRSSANLVCYNAAAQASWPHNLEILEARHVETGEGSLSVESLFFFWSFFFQCFLCARFLLFRPLESSCSFSFSSERSFRVSHPCSGRSSAI